MFRSSVRKYLRRLLALEDTPERIALGFAIGVFFAFSPLLGLHTFLGLMAAFLFGLNRPAVLIGVFINNPWTLVPIYGFAIYVGGMLVGFPNTGPMPHFGWKQIWSETFWVQVAGQWRMLKPLLLGSSVLAVLTSILSYLLARYLIIKGRAYQARQDGVTL